MKLTGNYEQDVERLLEVLQDCFMEIRRLYAGQPDENFEDNPVVKLIRSEVPPHRLQ